MSVLLLGATGRVGTHLHDRWPDAVTSPHLLRFDEVDACVRRVRPRWIVNAAVIHTPVETERDPGPAFRVNALLPYWLAIAARECGARLLHLSSNYVLGDGGDRTEAAPLDPVSAYGRTKASGERLAASPECADVVIVRTAAVFGRGGRDFVTKLLGHHEVARVVRDHTTSVTYAADLAETVARLVHDEAPAGVYHVVNEGAPTWLEYAAEVVRLTNAPLRLKPVSAAEYGDPVPRPAHGELVNTKLSPLRSWQAALAEFLA